MAANFKVVVSRERDDLHLDLAGDFDGSSALELINALLENSGPAKRVFIDTNGLREVHPFGKAVFQRHLPSAAREKPCMIFIGRFAEEIAPHSEGNARRQILMQ